MSVITPELGVDEHGHHARQQERPPNPIAGHTLLTDDIGDEIRRPGRERGGHHRHAQEPPRHAATGEKKICRAAPGTLRHRHAHGQRDRHETDDDCPVDRIYSHRSIIEPWAIQ
jgi:hypothetical protein